MVKDSSGSSVDSYIVPGNNTSHLFSGLTENRKYWLSAVGVNYSGNGYNSIEISTWTDEGGTYMQMFFYLFIFVPSTNECLAL